MIDFPTPYYLLDERLLRRNLSLIADIARRADVEFILAFKAFALWKTFPIFREYIHHTTASSPYEARLAYEEFGSGAHTYTPAYEASTFDIIKRCSSHITFNSLSQYARFAPTITPADNISIGLRINPEHSHIETALYDPCAPGSRFGLLADDLPDTLPADIKGFHCHCHCESSAEDFIDNLTYIERKFGRWFPQIEWLNLGGGHLVTRADYDVDRLITALRGLHERYPHLHLIMEPGSAFAWQTGDLIAEVVDIVENHGIKTAILNVSFTCHMPDCLEMPYHPVVEGAQTLPDTPDTTLQTAPTVYRLGGNSCLSGDYMGYWRFEKPLEIGQRLVLKDMIHYTTVKTNMFNGIHHPALLLQHTDGSVETLRTYTYEDYRDRMD